MTNKKLYRYLGRNGILTTRIRIDGATFIPVTELTANQGMVLTNGEKTVYSIIVEDEDINLWREIPDKVN